LKYLRRKKKVLPYSVEVKKETCYRKEHIQRKREEKKEVNNKCSCGVKYLSTGQKKTAQLHCGVGGCVV